MLVLHSFAMFCLAVKGYAALPEHKDLHTAHAYTETDTDIVTEALKAHFPWIQYLLGDLHVLMLHCFSCLRFANV